jgi:hypothetical protein
MTFEHSIEEHGPQPFDEAAEKTTEENQELGIDLSCLKSEVKNLKMKGEKGQRSSNCRRTRGCARRCIRLRPTLIIFYRVPGTRGMRSMRGMCGILTFKHRAVKPDHACLEKCTEFGVDPTAFGEQLKVGLTTPETTTCF